jgi:uncharacterized protein YbjT (DUF2867 family)
MSATRAGTAAMKSASKKAAPEGGRIAVLLGASGATGKVLLPLLFDDPRYAKVVTLSRRKLGIRHPRLEDRVVDFEHLAAGFDGLQADDCYCTFGTTIRIAGSEAAMTRIDHDYVVAFAAAGLAAGATRFAYLSAANADAGSSVFYARLKGRTEEALKALGYRSLSVFRPSMIIAERADRRWAESILFPLLPVADKLMRGSLAKFRSIPVETLARAIAVLGCRADSGVATYYWSEMVAA